MKQIRTQNKHIASIFISPPRNKYTCQKRIYASSSRARAYDVEEEDEYVNDEDGYDIEEDDMQMGSLMMMMILGILMNR